jgi:hypothetical protein
MFLRERVKMIDHHERLPHRPLFEQTIPLKNRLGSDLQVFGYEAESAADKATRDRDDIWSLMRQDPYLNTEPSHFLVAHWKHTLSGIRLLDLIPGSGTSILPR